MLNADELNSKPTQSQSHAQYWFMTSRWESRRRKGKSGFMRMRRCPSKKQTCLLVCRRMQTGKNKFPRSSLNSTHSDPKSANKWLVKCSRPCNETSRNNSNERSLKLPKPFLGLQTSRKLSLGLWTGISSTKQRQRSSSSSLLVVKLQSLTNQSSSPPLPALWTCYKKDVVKRLKLTEKKKTTSWKKMRRERCSKTE